ncbi:chromate efflux transporter [Comamonas terrigena]|uniref:chromate efflux transporter n=1 Tax=Comamonas terrigena TaxID=32013 RepID=UPI00244ACE12|nr:chromate efflux transporter [Comamonas terrigena]MDH1701284.1 chromate efflux transporter [Comamonas terrigena]
MTSPPAASTSRPPARWRQVLEVFIVFLQLGLTSFGGPVAHLGYFRTAFVQRRQWLSDAQYADLVALCQFLPGPASSQVGMALGQLRAGGWGALAAWLGFTLPSALLLIALALGLSHAGGQEGALHGVLHGLKLVAVAVVAQAVWGMGRSLCPDRLRAGLAFGAAVLTLGLSSHLGASAQLLVIALGALIGWRWVRPALPASTATDLALSHLGISRRTGAALLLLCLLLGLALPLLAHSTRSPLWQAVSVFYQAGALVFGGGHVVLPLLQSGVVQPGWLSSEQFLAGYAAAQAVPGPLFTLASYLGALLPLGLGSGAWSAGLGGLLALVVIFLPAALLVLGALPFWAALRAHPVAQRVLAGVNAAVVGLLLAALYDPVWTSAIHSRQDCALALLYLALLAVARVPPVAVVLLAAGLGHVLVS